MPPLKNTIKHLKLNNADYEIIVPFSVFLIITFIVMVLVRMEIFDSEKLKSSDQLLSTPVIETDLSNTSIEIGAYIDNIYMLSISNKTFDANGSIWLTWPQKAEDFFNRKGKWILLLAAIPFWGPLFAVSAGILRYRLFHFLILVGFSKFIGQAINIFF